MTLSELIEDARLYVPSALVDVINDTQLTRLLNRATKDIAYRLVCLPSEDYFDSEADVGTYDLSTLVDSFLLIDKQGLWWYDGSQYKQLDPKTMKWLDENRPNWRTEGSGEPQYYAKRGATLHVVPAPDTTTSNGFLLYYGKNAPSMSSSGHYPFSATTTLIDHLEPLDECILRYVAWKLKMILGTPDEARNFKAEYLQEITEHVALMGRQRDISSARDTMLRGPSFRRLK